MILEELDGISEFIKAMYPSSDIKKQTVPLNPALGTFVVRFNRDNKELETAARYVSRKIWEITYFAYDVRDALQVMDFITHTCSDQRLMIPIPNSLSYIRVKSVGFTQPILNENDEHIIMGEFHTETRTALSQEMYDTIQQASITIHSN
jgi:hypothetical protein